MGKIIDLLCVIEKFCIENSDGSETPICGQLKISKYPFHSIQGEMSYDYFHAVYNGQNKYLERQIVWNDGQIEIQEEIVEKIPITP